ncbi:cytochrome b [Denitrobaculum tricleocarpae]|uniref:Cytochrome b n=1 Tax=Denitrobaculum tricleocarpae TaxID=2591009 RepID=A0A545U129_9PROT|nr:cytochrome b [Denitrobaculum tricleocarpae]TQV83177.1 cytochrome b [Denitrobaculum tricleocarpae]
MQRNATYGFTSRVNHWVIAAVMIGMLGFGLYLAYGELPRDERGDLIAIHKSIGVLALGFGLWRVLWRVVRGFPAAVAGMPAWQERASKVAHWALLASVLLMPLSGVVASLFRGRPVEVFGWFTIPAQAEVTWLASLGSGIHQFAGYALVALVVIHIAAALKHHVYDRDPTLKRMLSSASLARGIGDNRQGSDGLKL